MAGVASSQGQVKSRGGIVGFESSKARLMGGAHQVGPSSGKLSEWQRTASNPFTKTWTIARPRFGLEREPVVCYSTGPHVLPWENARRLWSCKATLSTDYLENMCYIHQQEGCSKPWSSFSVRSKWTKQLHCTFKVSAG